MSYQERLDIYRKIEDLRGHPLICYVTSIRPQVSGQISSDVIPEFIKQISEIPEEHQEVDLLVVSNGGDPIAVMQIIGLLRERFSKVSVLLPYVAFSAATLMALGADEIVMHPFSNLGPVDPQLVVTRLGQGGILETTSYGVEDLRNYLAFVKSEVGISDQKEMARAFEFLCREVGPVSVGIARRSAHLTTALGEKLLSLHMKDGTQTKTITETLSRSYHHHGYPLRRSEAESIGLPIMRASRDLEKNMWVVWEDLEKEMECSKAFDPVEIILNDPSAAQLLDPVTQIQMPANLPLDLMQAVYNQILEQISVVTVSKVDYDLLLVALESLRGRSEFRNRGIITAVREPNMNIVASVVQLFGGWIYTRADEQNFSEE